jgi:eukaryotic-like serine/threonine-protein kinase
VTSPPEMIAEFRLLAPLGSGGMGDVYVGHDTLLDRPVAVKLLHEGGAGAGGGQAPSLVEARAAARIQHPNVATIHRVGEEGGQAFIVSELVRGKSLDQLAKPLAWQEALKIAIGLARGLAAAHRRGVLHGDIKPANAILADDGVVKLVDFGLARLLDADGRIPQDDGELFGGTPSYMAPELWAGQPLTKRSDVYSMGALLHELSAGQPPLHGLRPHEISVQAIRGGVPPIATVAPNIDPRFAEILDRCLRRAPAERHASAEELREALEQLEAAGTAAAIPEGNPYRGLLAFEAEHRALFFGRETEVGTILERLRSDALVVVAGDSGTGKSSLCRAGVLPRTVEGALDRARRYTAVQLVPGRRPIAALAAALAPALGKDDDEVAEMLRADPETLRTALAALTWNERGVLIFVDQLEELLTLSDPEEATAVSEALGRLAMRVPGVRLLMAIRGDFLARATALPGLGDELASAIYLLRPLSPEKMRQAIVGPARAKGVTFESDELVESLVRSTARAEGGLPLLQFALSELWEAKVASSAVISARSLGEIGGVEGALARHADHVLNTLPAAQQSAARRMLCSLVTAQRTRARRMEDELTGDDPSARAALAALVRGRLLVATEAEGGTAVEIAHEALVTGWFTLRRLLDEQAEALAVRDRLEKAAADWKRLGRNREALWGAVQLAEAARLDAAFLTQVERDFLEASRARVAQRRRLRAALVLLVPALIASIYGFAALKARRDLQGRLVQLRAEAAGMLAEAERVKGTLDDAERQAFEAYDGMRRDDGERLWAEARGLYSTLDARYREAAQKIETALALDTASAEVQSDLARVLYLRVLVAERRHQAALRDELVERLAVYDAAGHFRALLEAPARVHLETEPPGASVTLERYELAPEAPAKLGAPRDLGATPLDAEGLSPGSYLLTLRMPGRVTVRYPVMLRRGEALPLRVALPREDQVPEGFVYVPEGRFLFGSSDEEMMRKSFLVTVPIHEARTGPYLIARHETTFGEWIDYLRSLGPEERLRRLPRAAEGDLTGNVTLSELSDGTFQLAIKPSTITLTAKAGEPLLYPSRARGRQQDWRRLPLMGVLIEDIRGHLAWLDRTGKVKGARLCTDHEWERAARGADERLYPHGGSLLPEDANYYDTYGKEPSAVGPDEVGSHPRSTSPFGVDDMAGNIYEWVGSSLVADELAIRGGSYFFDAVSARSSNRTAVDPNYRDSRLGLRVCASIVLQ